MRVDYHYLIQEIESMSTLDGFISACLEIRDSMLFYDRELLLTAYSSTLELLLVSALYWASLEAEQDIHEAVERWSLASQGLRRALTESVLPMDIQNLGEHYLRSHGWALNLRVPLYEKIFTVYSRDEGKSGGAVDAQLVQAQEHLLRGAADRGEDALASVGAQVLRGAHIRPIWFHIGHQRLQIYLAGIQTMANNFSVAPYFSFPFEDITTERRKRRRSPGGTVVDLKAFRNFRRESAGYTDRRIVIEPDALDRVLERLGEEGEALDDLIEALESYREEVVPILQAAASALAVQTGRNEDSLISRRALHILAHWGEKVTAAAALDVLTYSDPWDAGFQESLRILQQLGHKAVPAVRKFAKEQPDGPLPIIIADTLSRGRPSKRVTALLRELFERSHWGEGREIIGAALARMGNREDLAYLREKIAQEPASRPDLMEELLHKLQDKEEESHD